MLVLIIWYDMILAITIKNSCEIFIRSFENVASEFYYLKGLKKFKELYKMFVRSC